MLHSLDRVTRRVERNHFLRILSGTEGNARRTPQAEANALRAIRKLARDVPNNPRQGVHFELLPHSTRSRPPRPINTCHRSNTPPCHRQCLQTREMMRRPASERKCSTRAARATHAARHRYNGHDARAPRCRRLIPPDRNTSPFRFPVPGFNVCLTLISK